MLLRLDSLGHQHGKPIGTGNPQRLCLQQQSGAAGVIDDIQYAGAAGKGRQVCRGRAVAGIHPDGCGVDDKVSVSVTAESFVVVRTGAGDHRDLPGALLPECGLRCQRRASAA